MKILFVSKGDLPDYQSDMLFHGLRSLYGEDCVDANKIWYMYTEDKDNFWNIRVPNGGKSYGHGFTIHGKLPELNVDRRDIKEKISDRFYDLIVYGSITRCNQYIAHVSQTYSPNEIVFIDGEDNQNVDINLMHYGTIFKRELADNIISPRLFPIEFAIPASQIVDKVPEKTKDWAHIIPGQLETYIFQDEASYYADYQKSMFALTYKKGGHDAQRHYEILANGCVPYFTTIDDCPKSTMITFPKAMIKESNAVIKSGNLDMNWYSQFSNELLTYTKNKLTTTTMAGRVLDKLL